MSAKFTNITKLTDRYETWKPNKEMRKRIIKSAKEMGFVFSPDDSRVIGYYDGEQFIPLTIEGKDDA